MEIFYFSELLYLTFTVIPSWHYLVYYVNISCLAISFLTRLWVLIYMLSVILYIETCKNDLALLHPKNFPFIFDLTQICYITNMFWLWLRDFNAQFHLWFFCFHFLFLWNQQTPQNTEDDSLKISSFDWSSCFR